VLLAGPLGHGKTSLAEAIAEALSVPLLTVRYDAVIGRFLGETEGRLRRVFDLARTTPSVLFFDELDVLVRNAGTSTRLARSSAS
jgi:SpoVK/Ycf46/Vps4 family AAA+-type ATPase